MHHGKQTLDTKAPWRALPGFHINILRCCTISLKELLQVVGVLIVRVAHEHCVVLCNSSLGRKVAELIMHRSHSPAMPTPPERRISSIDILLRGWKSISQWRLTPSAEGWVPAPRRLSSLSCSLPLHSRHRIPPAAARLGFPPDLKRFCPGFGLVWTFPEWRQAHACQDSTHGDRRAARRQQPTRRHDVMGVAGIPEILNINGARVQRGMAGTAVRVAEVHVRIEMPLGLCTVPLCVRRSRHAVNPWGAAGERNSAARMRCPGKDHETPLECRDPSMSGAAGARRTCPHMGPRRPNRPALPGMRLLP